MDTTDLGSTAGPSGTNAAAPTAGVTPARSVTRAENVTPATSVSPAGLAGSDVSSEAPASSPDRFIITPAAKRAMEPLPDDHPQVIGAKAPPPHGAALEKANPDAG